MDVLPLAVVPPPRRRRPWLRCGLLVVAGLAALVAAAPSIISSNQTLRDFVVRAAAGDLDGDVTVDSLSLGWFAPLRISGLAVRPHQGERSQPWEPALTVEHVHSERLLWRMLTSPGDMGSFRIERPVVFVRFSAGRNNFAELFRTVREPSGWSQSLGAEARIVDGTLRWRSSDEVEPWQIAGINVGVGLRPAARAHSGKPELLVAPGKLIDNAEISLGLCEDLLKYAAPVVARAARAQGRLTIELDAWRLPWGDFASGTLGGRIVMHSVNVGPGPMVSSLFQSIVALPLVDRLIGHWRLPNFVELARESTVPFRMLAGGRIAHENLRFSIADVVDVRTAGTVGLDESLDLRAELGIHPPRADERYLALLRQLTSTPWPVRIHGKLGVPQVDTSPLAAAWKDLVFEKLPADWLSGKSSLGADAVNRLGSPLGLDAQDAAQLLGAIRRAVEPPPASAPAAALQPPPNGPSPSGSLPDGPSAVPAEGAAVAAEAISAAATLLELLRERREQAARAAPPVPPSGSAVTPSEPPVRRPLLRRGLRLLQEATEPPPPPPPPIATPTRI